MRLVFGAAPGTAPSCRFGLLGPTSVVADDGQPVHLDGGKVRALLALLLLNANRVLPVEQLEDLLWTGTPPSSVRGAMHAYVSRLRASLRGVSGADLVGRRGTYELAMDPADLDVHRFETQVADLDETGVSRLDSDGLDAALQLWRGPALVDVRFVDELAHEATRLEELRMAAVEARLDGELFDGRHATAVSTLGQLIAEHPYRERLHGQLMLALYRSGRQSEALSAYQRAYRLLRDEVGVSPGAQLRDLERAIAVQDPTLDLGAEPPAGPASTGTPGPFDQAWHDACTGRRRLVVIHLPAESGGQSRNRAESVIRTLVERTRRGGGARDEAVLQDERPARILRCQVHPNPTDPYEPVVDALAGAGFLRPRPAAPPDDPATALYLFFEAVVGQLQTLGARRRLVLVFEDLHLAGRSLLALVEHLVRHRDRAPILPVVALTGHSGALRGLLTRLQFDGLCTDVDADGVDPGGLGRADQAPPPDEPTVAEPSTYAQRARSSMLDAVRLATRAGDAATAHLGFDEAAEHYRIALDALVVAGADPSAPGGTALDDTRRAELLIARGRALHAIYALSDAIESYRDATHAALAAGDHELLAEAAVGLGTIVEYGMVDEALFAVLRDALGRPAAGGNGTELDPAVRARVLAGMARARPIGDPEGVALAHQAEQLARQAGDRMVMARTLATRIPITWSVDNAAERLVLSDELVALADDLQCLDLAMEARFWRAATCEQLGDKAAAARDRAIVVAWAEQTRRPYFAALATQATVAGHLDAGRIAEAEAALATVPDRAAAAQNFAAGFAAQHVLLRLLQGHRDEVLPLLDAASVAPGAPAAWQTVRPVLLIEIGQRERARRVLADQIRSFDQVPRDWLWLCSISQLADATIALQDRAAAERLLPLLEPFTGQQVIVAHGVLLMGSVDARIAGLCALTGEGDRALVLIDRAVDQEQCWGAQLSLIRTLQQRERLHR